MNLHDRVQAKTDCAPFPSDVAEGWGYMKILMAQLHTNI